ncbi:hypothetical protein RUND412_010120, partial [Rhizina undulata]
MRNGSYIRALGRQSFEPSRPPSSSTDALVQSSTSEESQEMQRRLIKAQNDVLATVGVCLRDTKHHLDKSAEVTQENKVGLIVGAVDLTITYMSGWPLIGIRNRIQTYRSYDGMGFREVIRLAWRSQSIAQMFSGMPAHLIYQLVSVGREYIQIKFIRWVKNKPFFKNPRTGRPRFLPLLCVHKLLSFTGWLLAYPLYHHAILQSLHLLPPYPLLPPASSFIPFSSTSPLSVLPSTTITTFFPVFFRSYFFYAFIHQTFCTSFQPLLFTRIRSLLPKPDYPDPASVDGALCKEDLNLPSFDPSNAENPNRTDNIGVQSIVMEEGENGVVNISVVLTEPSPPPPSSYSSPYSQPAATNSNKQQHRVTHLSERPAEAVASHIADAFATTMSISLESTILRIMARTFLMGVAGGAGVAGVWMPNETWANWKLIAKALIG